MLTRVIWLPTLALLSAGLAIPEKRASQIDTVSHGPYTIANCESANTTKITTSLDNLADYLVPVLQDADKSALTPSPAFSTFFKDHASASYVSSVLTNVSTGPAMYPSIHYSNGAPIFACLQDGDDSMLYENSATSTKVNAFTWCQQHPKMATYIITGTPFIVLCPNFFTGAPTLPAAPPGYPISVPAPRPGLDASDCLRVSASRDLFMGDGSVLTTFTPWLLLEEIVHYYLTATGRDPDAPALNTYDPNRCVRLGAQESVQNAHSFVYYAASVYGQCKDFPTNITTDIGRQALATKDVKFPAGVVNGATDVVFGGYSQLNITGARYY